MLGKCSHPKHQSQIDIIMLVQHTKIIVLKCSHNFDDTHAKQNKF